MRLSAVLFLVASSAVLLSGCRASSSETEVSPAEKTLRAKCLSCHGLPKPDQKPRSEWAEFLREHGKRANLTAQQLKLITSHLSARR